MLATYARMIVHLWGFSRANIAKVTRRSHNHPMSTVSSEPGHRLQVWMRTGIFIPQLSLSPSLAMAVETFPPFLILTSPFPTQ